MGTISCYRMLFINSIFNNAMGAGYFSVHSPIPALGREAGTCSPEIQDNSKLRTRTELSPVVG